MSYINGKESRGLGAVAALDMARRPIRKPIRKPARPTVRVSPSAMTQLIASVRSMGTPKAPFVSGQKGWSLAPTTRSDLAITTIPSPNPNYAAPQSKDVMVPLIESAGAGTVSAGLMTGPAPSSIVGRPLSVPTREMSTAESPRGLVDESTPELPATASPSLIPPAYRKLAVYGGLAAAALGAWWLLRRRG